MPLRRPGKCWQALHQLVYPISTLGLVHYWWLVKKDVTLPLVYGVVLAVLLGINIYYKSQHASTVQPYGHVPAFPTG